MLTETQKIEILSALQAVPELRQVLREHFRELAPTSRLPQMDDTVTVEVEDDEPEFRTAKVVVGEKARVLMCVPFPEGKPLCAQCGDSEITHTVVYEMVTKGEEGTTTAFGCLCTKCAEKIEVKLEPGEN